jgi:energy-converting hydrogenase Eha subunit A
LRVLFVPTVVATTFFLATYLLSYLTIGKGPFEMDPGGEPKAFEEHLKRYQGLFQLLITLSTATVAFLVNFLIGISEEKPRNVYSYQLEAACPFAILVLGFSVIFALLFIVFENLAYEAYSEYLQAKAKNTNSTRKSPYSRPWYAANLSFGYSSLLLFLTGYGFIAFRLLRG